MTTMASDEKKRILIIEDEPDIVRGLEDALEFEGFGVLSKPMTVDGHIGRNPGSTHGLVPAPETQSDGGGAALFE